MKRKIVEKVMKTSKAQAAFLIIFFGIFIIAGVALASYGFVRLAKYNFAERVEATVISTEYIESGGLDVTFGYERNGEIFETRAHYNNLKEVGASPVYNGTTIHLRIDSNNNVVQFGTAQIVIIIGGVAFTAVGATSLYFFILRKRTLLDIAYSYEQAMVNPELLSDPAAVYEAEADQLTKLPEKSMKRMLGEGKVWGHRIADRFKSYSVAENIFFGILLFVPMILLGISPLFFNRPLTLGSLLIGALEWLFVFCFVGLFFKGVYSLYIKILVSCGKFSQKTVATVVHSVFESALEFKSGEFSRTHTVFKKFRVVALIDGKRSVGYVKGNIPPPKGAELRVLIRPRRPKRWIIDNAA